MYSHELQTCDWPRNVGCEVRESAAPLVASQAFSSGRDVQQRVPQQLQPHQQQHQQPQHQQQQQVPSHKFRFSSVQAGPASGPSGPAIPAQVQALPPPPELRIAPNPVITSRGQPKFSEQEDIAKVR